MASSLAKTLLKEKFKKELSLPTLPPLEEYGEHLFAKTLMERAKLEDPELSLFLRKLFVSAREGNLCLKTDLEIALEPFEPYIVREENRYYLRSNWECENEFFSLVQKLLQNPVKRITLLEGHLNKEQEKAVIKAIQSPLTLICGGPGTGKTYTAKILIDHFLKHHPEKEVVVAAPTGKAAANLRAYFTQTKTTISTLQHLVNVGKKTHYLPYDFFVVDEGGMIDAFLFRNLFALLKKGAQVVILGDSAQLPPVGTGAFFLDLVTHLPEQVAWLKKSLRAEGQEILDLIKSVENNLQIPLTPLPELQELLCFLVERLALHEDLALDTLFANYRKFRFLSPQRQGLFGVDYLNQRLYESHLKCLGKRRWIPLIITTNAPKLGLYNGDFGFFSEEEEFAYFEGDKKVARALLPSFEYGYLLSVHKSQGSEYDEVMLLLPSGAEIFGKEMLYTAITRAKRKATIFADSATYTKTVQNSASRVSGLGEKLEAHR